MKRYGPYVPLVSLWLALSYAVAVAPNNIDVLMAVSVAKLVMVFMFIGLRKRGT